LEIEMNRGRRPFTPTKAQRTKCEILAAGRMSEADIAAVFGISRPTLRKAFAAELTAGAARRTAAALEALYESALSGNVAALRCWLARRAGAEAPAVPGKKQQAEAEGLEPPSGEWAALLPH